MSSYLLLASTLLGLAMSSPAALPSLLEKRSDITCPDMNSTTVISNGKSFIVECGIDHAGGNLPNQPVYVSGLAGCVSACAETDACVDFTLSGSACYMKGSVGPNVYGGANGARLIGVESGKVYLTCGTVG
ncbi:related to alpha-amylase A precursor [Lecanosticta acicola]|uniref:Related to alpha-amylase A n=1 Tax=Lecanosticta acicola TaxID=111012 RepID=A0AAI8Z1E1_9PEZI|nr:related to alpha-amylase A precursor [Lecanosticta acicola]